MATSLGEGIEGIAQGIRARAGIVEYVTIASTVSLVVGGVILPKLINPHGPSCPPPPPCDCYCACLVQPAH